MKTRTYLKGCEWCNATGVVPSTDSASTMATCPVCNGNKVVLVTETES